jgi:hypothetical protein
MIALTVKGGLETRARLARAAAELPTLAERVIRNLSFLMSKKLKERVASREGGSDPFWGKLSPQVGALLRGRSGGTALRITPGGIVLKRGRDVSAAVGSPDRHVAFLEHGGTRRGTSPKGFLRIPTRHMQTLGGSDRLAGASARTLTGTFFLRSKAGNLWIATRDRGNRLTLLYLLKKSVFQRGRGIFATVAREVNGVAGGVAQVEVSGFIRRANG